MSDPAEHTTITVEIAKEAERQLTALARKSRTSKERMVERIVIQYLQDAEDYEAVRKFRASGEKGSPLSAVAKRLGLGG